MSLSKFWPFYIAFILLIGCKNDKVLPLENAGPIEQDYFEDYESPKHKWGCIDKKGRVVIEPIYDDLKDMQNGIAAANYEGRWGYIDSIGTKLIGFQYKQAYNFTDDQTFVQDFSNNWLLIDRQGHTLDSLPYTTFESYQDGYAVVGSRGLKGIIDRKGKMIVPAIYESIKIGADGNFIGKKNGLYGLSHISGKSILPPEYQKIYAPPYGALYRLKKDSNYSYYNLQGQIKSDTYTKANDFHYDRTVVKNKEGYIMITNDMKFLQKLPYDKVEYAGESKWKYKKGAKWGLLDSKGDVLTEAHYDLLNRYSDGMLAASKDKQWGYLNDKGEEVIDFRHPLVWDYHDGLARMIDQRGVGFLDKNGNLVIDDMFIEVRDFYNGRARFQTY